MLFLGKHDYSMDERGRVPLPPRYRDDLMKGIVLTEGTPELCLRAYSLDKYEEQAAVYLSEPVTTPTGRVLRNAFARAQQVELDKQGRVLVPPRLRQFAGLDGQVVIVGNGDSFLIWDADEYEKNLQAEEATFRQTLGSE